jgi:hypothetical protein
VHQSLHGLLPSLHGASYLYLAVGIIGATVMPHVIYLHSALTNGRMPVRNDDERRRVLRFERLDVIIALGLAGVINLAMLAVAAKLFHTPALSGLSTIQDAHHEFGRLVGGGAALAFAVALLASGASSSSVGTFAGQVVMAGFVKIKIPLLVRRAVTMIPALVVLAIGVSPTSALVLSQVVLSFRMPLADTFDQLVASLPDDWTDLELDLRIFDERRYVDAAEYLVTCNAQPYSKHDWHWRLLVAHRFGHAAAVPAVHLALKLLDDAEIAGELAEREVRTGRVEVTQMWGRPESVRQEFKRLRAQ